MRKWNFCAGPAVLPEDVLKDHDVSYDKEWIAKCVDQSKRNETAIWDEDGNLLT